VGISLALLLLPSAFSQKLRLTALAGLRPFHALACATIEAPSRVLPAGDDAPLRVKCDYLSDQVQRQANEISILRQQLEAAAALKPLVREQNFKLLPADVLLPTDGSPWRKSLTLARGSRDGVQRGMLVVYHHQLVGRVIEAGPWTSRVRVATDPGFRAGAVAAPRTSQGVALEQRHVGVYEGTAGRNGLLKWLTGETPVGQDSYVLTTDDPANGVPRGLILGRVSKPAVGRGAFPRVEVEPVLDFRALEHVTVLIPDMTK
jgi:rod shape-determining protein MreC